MLMDELYFVQKKKEADSKSASSYPKAGSGRAIAST